MQQQSGQAWKQFASKVAGWLMAAGLAWLYPGVFLDEPIDYLVPAILRVAGLHLGFLGSESQARVELRLVGYEGPDQFVRRLHEVK